LVTLLAAFVSQSAQAQVFPTYPALLNTYGTSDTGWDQGPQIATDGAGNWVSIWFSRENLGGTAGTDWDIVVVRSTDNWATWTEPALLNSNGTIDSWDDVNPQLVTDGAGNWVAIWMSHYQPHIYGTDWDLFTARSTDNGETWSNPVLLNTDGATNSNSNWSPDLATDGLGNWIAVWDLRQNSGIDDYDIYFARSTDNGATWTSPAILNPDGTSDDRYDSGAHVAADGGGNWVAVWDCFCAIDGIDDDVFVSRSSDGGATWTSSALLNTNGTSDSGSDRHSAVTTDGAGNWVAVWYSTEDLGGVSGNQYNVFVARSTDNGASWTSPALLNNYGITNGDGNHDPEVITDKLGHWVAVWTDPGGFTDLDTYLARSTDNGASWSSPALLNATGGSDLGDDRSPHAATDGAGNWFAVWQSHEDISGTAGTESDIFVARLVVVDSTVVPIRRWALVALFVLFGLAGAAFVRRRFVASMT
jgi:hypothetical protein